MSVHHAIQQRPMRGATGTHTMTLVAFVHAALLACVHVFFPVYACDRDMNKTRKASQSQLCVFGDCSNAINNHMHGGLVTMNISRQEFKKAADILTFPSCAQAK
jgi:hypothetical protein